MGVTGLGGDKGFCNVFIDEILVFSYNETEHVEHLHEVFWEVETVWPPVKCKFACGIWVM